MSESFTCLMCFSLDQWNIGSLYYITQESTTSNQSTTHSQHTRGDPDYSRLNKRDVSQLWGISLAETPKFKSGLFPISLSIWWFENTYWSERVSHPSLLDSWKTKHIFIWIFAIEFSNFGRKFVLLSPLWLLHEYSSMTFNILDLFFIFVVLSPQKKSLFDQHLGK